MIAAPEKRGMGMDIKKKIMEYKRSTIDYYGLIELSGCKRDADLYLIVTELVKEGILSPVKNARTNGNRTYPISMKYRIISQEDYSEEINEMTLLHPLLLKTGHLQAKPEYYRKYKKELNQLSDYLFLEKSAISVSRKERSFDIFDDEKKLEDRPFCSLLNRLGVTPDRLLYYSTPEQCFNDYIPFNKSRMKLLILENKDLWFNIRRRMFEDRCKEIMGTKIDGVIYGEGNRISENGALDAYTAFLNADTVHYLYWGDIDKAGIDIYLSVLENNPNITIELFKPGYEMMLVENINRVADGRALPDSDDTRPHAGKDYESILKMFPRDMTESILEIFRSNKRLPQEIINYECLLKHMR